MNTNNDTDLNTLENLPPSSLHDRVYEVCNSCYAPESAPNGDVSKEATQDILKIISQELEKQRKEIVESLKKEKDNSVGNCKTCGGYYPCVHQDMYQQGIDKAIGRITGVKVEEESGQ